MASLIDGCYSLSTNPLFQFTANEASNSIWLRNDNHNHNPKVHSSFSNKSLLKKSNSAHILNDDSYCLPPSTPGDSTQTHHSLLSETMRFTKIPLDSVLISEKLGNGQYGDVFKAVYRVKSSIVEVAIKKLKLIESSGDELSADEKQTITQRFVREASKSVPKKDEKS